MGKTSVIHSPTVSIIIPTYNRLFLLGELVESLNKQTFKDFEIIIVNDCGEKVNKIIQLYPKLDIRIIDMGSNQKHVFARNKGVMNAIGEFIMLIDDDDLLVPSHIEQMVEEIRNYDLVYSDVEIVNYNVEDHVRIPTNRFLFGYELDLKAMRRFSTFVASGCLYRREIHKIIGIFDTEVYHYWDWDFFLRVSEKFRVKRVPVASVLYEFSNSGNNESKNLSSMRTYLDILSKKHTLGYLPAKNFFLLLDEPEVKERKAESKIVWDGKPFISKLVLESE
jgi:glycosyltransferase involved in cell wall biosynthesis